MKFCALAVAAFLAASDCRDAACWKALGAAQAARQQFALAAVSFEKACALDAKLEDACYYLGRAEYVANRYEASLEALEKALPVEKRPWRVYTAMGEAFEALGRAPEAERSFKKALDNCRGSNERPGLAYGVFLFRQGRTEDALRQFQDVLARFPDSPAANFEAGRALWQLNRVAGAIPLLEKAVKLDPASAPARLLLDKAYTRAGRAPQGSRTVR